LPEKGRGKEKGYLTFSCAPSKETLVRRAGQIPRISLKGEKQGVLTSSKSAGGKGTGLVTKGKKGRKRQAPCLLLPLEEIKKLNKVILTPFFL